MIPAELREIASELNKKIQREGKTNQNIMSMVYIAETAIKTYGDRDFAFKVSAKAKEYLEGVVRDNYNMGVWKLEKLCFDKGVYDDVYGALSEEVKTYYEILKFEGYYLLDSYALYIERKRKPEERMYLPRRKTLIKVMNILQKLEDDEIDEAFIHMPPRTGKSLCMTIGCAWHCARHQNESNLYATYKESLGGAFINGLMEIWTDPTYCHNDIFPTKIAFTDSKNHKVDLGRKKKYATISGKGLESGLNGEYDAKGWLIIDDIIEGIQDAMNPDILQRKQIVFDNNLMSRKKEGCKVCYNGTIWSLYDIFSNRLNFLQNSPDAHHIRIEILKIPALDEETDESNFDYDYGVGFTTQYYHTLRAKFEENDDIASWMAQYQQEPIERDGAVFTSEALKYYNGVLPNEQPYRICAACDVALGGVDPLALAIAYMYEDGSIYIHDVVFDASEKNITIPKVVEKFIENDVGSAFFEANQGGEGYKDEVDKALRDKGYKVNLKSEYAPTNKRKEQRIFDKAPSIRDFYFLDVGCRNVEYRKFMQNLFSFTMNGKNKHDDAPDCLATLAYFIEGSWTSKIEIPINPFRTNRMGVYGR